MMHNPNMTVEVDQMANVAYVRFSTEPTVRTLAHDDAINIDLDQFGMVVGIEVLSLGAPMPFGDLTARYHVDSHKVDLLRMICPTISGFVATFENTGSLSARTEAQAVATGA